MLNVSNVSIIFYCSMLLYYHSWMFYNHFISFFGTNLLTQCQVQVVVFSMFFTSQKINIKRTPNAAKLFVDFFGPEDIQWAKEVPKREPEVSTRHQGAPGGPGAPWWVVPTSGAPGPPLCSINTPIFQKPQGSQRKAIPAAASSRNTRFNLDTIIEGFIMSIGASPMMREQFFVDLRVRSQQLDGFISLLIFNTMVSWRSI